MALTKIGTVVSAKRDKTITVAVESRQMHPLYRKQYTVTRKYTAHDENNEAKLNDRVQISETRPYSKTKTWKMDKILAHAHEVIVLQDDTAEAEGSEK
ncbi:MAG: 30S ribosomal protein S17 [Candidatus Nomurabacteria bacterium]|jgi:small subunit ribosomal protein S17|nr:30S ribosomal protein S17 [Candidatus Nomurabacteria bacterium]